MDSETARVVVLATLGATAALWLLSTLLFRVAGTWERVLSDAELHEGQRVERITLGQLGPFVTGRRDVKGGHQEFSGLMIGRRLTLNRRDHGVKSLVGMGFPDVVAQKLDGTIVMARLRLSLTDGGVSLVGTFEPQKVEFTHQPPRITGVHFLPGHRRRYRRVTPVGERVPKIDEVEATEATS